MRSALSSIEVDNHFMESRADSQYRILMSAAGFEPAMPGRMYLWVIAAPSSIRPVAGVFAFHNALKLIDPFRDSMRTATHSEPCVAQLRVRAALVSNPSEDLLYTHGSNCSYRCQSPAQALGAFTSVCIHSDTVCYHR